MYNSKDSVGLWASDTFPSVVPSPVEVEPVKVVGDPVFVDALVVVSVGTHTIELDLKTLNL